MLLRELFNSNRSLPLEWDQDSAPDYIVARAYDRQGRLIEVNFNYNSDGQLDIEFQRGGSMNTTGHGDELIVFGTVMNAINEYMNQRGDTVDIVYFNGAADRQALYSKLAHRLGQQYGFHRAARPTGSVFKMVRNAQPKMASAA